MTPIVRLRHVAVAVSDPRAAADFYTNVFGWTHAGEGADPELGNAVFVSDGTVQVAFIRFSSDQTGHGLGFRGLHHIGVLTSDAQRLMSHLEAMGAERLAHATSAAGTFETKFRGPGELVFDVASRPWIGSLSLDRPAIAEEDARAPSPSATSTTPGSITHVYADEKGNSRFGELIAPSRHATHQHMPFTAGLPVTGAMFATAAAGTIFAQHTAPRRQFLIVLRGASEIETSDGAVRRFVPGDLLLVTDTTGRGHITRVLGTSLETLVVPLDDAYDLSALEPSES